MENFTYTPEKALGLAIIVRAVKDALGLVAIGQSEALKSKGGYLRREAFGWIFSAHDEKYRPEFSFPWWCDILEIEASRIRKFIYQGAKGKISANRADDIDFYLRIYDGNTTAEYKLVV